jgi:hypothetical protein
MLRSIGAFCSRLPAIEGVAHEVQKLEVCSLLLDIWWDYRGTLALQEDLKNPLSTHMLLIFFCFL